VRWRRHGSRIGARSASYVSRLPFIASQARDLPAVAVTFGVLPVERVITSSPSSSILPQIGEAIPIVWVCGAAAGLVWLMAGAWRVRQLRLRSVPAVMESAIDALRVDLAGNAEFRWSDDLQQPVTLGFRRPLVLLPRRFEDLTDDAKCAVACHELLHVQRRDWLWTVIEAQVRAVLWFHPGIWWLVDRLQLLREQVVDELVVGRTASRREYMLAMMAFADSARPTVLSSAFLRRRHLKSRIGELLKESHMSFRRLALTMMALTVVMVAVTAATVRALPLNLSAMAQTGAASRLEIRLAETTPGAGLREAVVSGSDQRLYLHPTPLATWADVTIARVIGPGNPTSVAVTFNSTAAARLASGTASHLGKPVAIILDGRIVAAPIVRSPISDSAVITGLTPASAGDLIDANMACHTNPAQCVAAALPVPVYQEKAVYTEAAMDAQIQGSVLLEVVVLPDGSSGPVTVVRSLDSENGLDQQAVDALKRWTWKPGTRDGEPARVAVQVEMRFTLR
jgi:TonB family protein